MKKIYFKKEFIFLLFFFYSIFSLGQTNYYYYKGVRTNLSVDGSRIGITSSVKKDSSSIEVKTRSTVTPFDDAAKARTSKKTFYFETGIGTNSNIETYNAKDWVLLASPCFLNSDLKKVGLTNNFYVKVGAAGTIDSLYKYAKIYKIEVLGYNKYMTNWFTLSCNKDTGFNALELANLFYETGLFAAAEPEFLQMPELHSVNSNKLYNRKLTNNGLLPKVVNKKKNTLNPLVLFPKNATRTIRKKTNHPFSKILFALGKGPSRQKDSIIDPLFAKQWYLDHTRLPDKFRDTVSIIDIGNIKKAWEMSRGDGVKVGVFDDGIDGTHEDFQGQDWKITEGKDSISPNCSDCPKGQEPAGIVNGKIIYRDIPRSVNTNPKTYGNIDGSPSRYGIHGTSIAGIIAAAATSQDTLVSDLCSKLKNVGGVGVAPKAKLFSIALPFHRYNKITHTLSSDYDVFTTNQQFADGFGEAVNSNVEVLNCAWTTNGNPSDMLDDGISNALYNGRKGKGIVVVFSAGNEDKNAIPYPANSNPDILVVGAMGPCGERMRPGSTCESGLAEYGSNYGPEVDIMAFGSDIVTTSTVYPPSDNEKINPATQIGLHPTNEPYSRTSLYIDNFQGTSAAAAMISGVAALILKDKPNLSASQVCIIIQHSGTPQKRRAEYTWGRTTDEKGKAINFLYGLGLNRGNYLVEEGFGMIKADEALEYRGKFDPRHSKAFPGKATFSDLTTNSVFCSWSPSLDIGKLYFEGVGYEYCFKKKGDDDKYLEKPGKDDKADGFTFGTGVYWTGLDKNANYAFYIRVVGQCILGAVPGQTDRSAWSEPVIFDTTCEAPTELKSSNGLGLTTISWHPIMPSQPCGDGYDYYVNTDGTPPSFSWKDGDKTVEQTTNTKATGSVDTKFQMYAILKNLAPNQPFHFWVRAKCKIDTWVYGGQYYADYISPDQTVCYGSKPSSDISISDKVPALPTKGGSISLGTGTTGTSGGGLSSVVPYEVKIPEVLRWQKSTDNTFTLFVEDIIDSANTTLKADVIGEITEATYFRAVVKDADGVNELYTNSVKVSPNNVTAWSDNVWSNGEPNGDSAAIINGDYLPTSGSGVTVFKDITACALVVKGNSNVIVPDEHTFTVANRVTVEDSANLTFKPGSSLMQSGDANINKGKIVFETGRIVTNSGKVCISSPVSDQQISTFAIAVTPDGSNLGFTIPALPNQVNSLDVSSGNYSPVDPEINNFIPGVGYEVGGDIVAPNTTFVFNGIYHGIPNNGNIDVPVTIDEFRSKTFLGNPYPSYIDGLKFLNDNKDVSGFYFRVDGNNLAAKNTDMNNFFAVNKTGSTATNTGGFALVSVPNPFGGAVAWPFMNIPKPDKFYIGVGVGFFVDVPVTTQTLKFNNGMRVSSKDYIADTNGVFSGSGAKLNSNKAKTASTTVANRIWLDMTNDKTSSFSQALVGYVDNATNSFDMGYDTRVLGINKYALYSLIDANPNLYTIQSRVVPFDNSDVVALGYMIPSNANVTISLDAFDGVFSSNSQNIFLEDKVLGVVQDLKMGSYTFNSNAGTFNDRFALRYDSALKISTLDEVGKNVLVANKNHQIMIKSQMEPIDRVTLYDLLGKQVFDKKAINNNDFSVKELNLGEQTLIVKITLTNGQVVTKKLLY